MAKRRQSSHNRVMASWNTAARKRLLNRRIVAVRYMDPDDCRQLMWGFAGVMFALDDGTTVYAARDAEGNDAGALHGITQAGEEFILPEVNPG